MKALIIGAIMLAHGLTPSASQAKIKNRKQLIATARARCVNSIAKRILKNYHKHQAHKEIARMLEGEEGTRKVANLDSLGHHHKAKKVTFTAVVDRQLEKELFAHLKAMHATDSKKDQSRKTARMIKKVRKLVLAHNSEYWEVCFKAHYKNLKYRL